MVSFNLEEEHVYKNKKHLWLYQKKNYYIFKKYCNNNFKKIKKISQINKKHQVLYQVYKCLVLKK